MTRIFKHGLWIVTEGDKEVAFSPNELFQACWDISSTLEELELLYWSYA